MHFLVTAKTVRGTKKYIVDSQNVVDAIDDIRFHTTIQEDLEAQIYATLLDEVLERSTTNIYYLGRQDN